MVLVLCSLHPPPHPPNQPPTGIANFQKATLHFMKRVKMLWSNTSTKSEAQNWLYWGPLLTPPPLHYVRPRHVTGYIGDKFC